MLLIKPLCKTANPLIQIQKEGPGYHKDVNKQSQQLPLPGTIVGKRLEPTPDNQAMWQVSAAYNLVFVSVWIHTSNEMGTDAILNSDGMEKSAVCK